MITNTYYRKGQYKAKARIAVGLCAVGVIAFLVFGLVFAAVEKDYHLFFIALFVNFIAGVPLIRIIQAAINSRPKLVLSDKGLVVWDYFLGGDLNWNRPLWWKDIGRIEIEEVSGDLIFRGTEDPTREVGRVHGFREFEQPDTILQAIGERLR